jgi:hypothetical protein
MTTRREQLAARLGEELDRIKGAGLVPPGYEINLVLRNKTTPGGHLHIGETDLGQLSTSISELIDNPSTRFEVGS